MHSYAVNDKSMGCGLQVLHRLDVATVPGSNSILEPTARLELTTSRVRIGCSPIELGRHSDSSILSPNVCNLQGPHCIGDVSVSQLSYMARVRIFPQRSLNLLSPRGGGLRLMLSRRRLSNRCASRIFAAIPLCSLQSMPYSTVPAPSGSPPAAAHHPGR